MKQNIIYIVSIIVLFLVLLWTNTNAPVAFRWVETYNTTDKQPYGCYAFDKILSQSIDYSHTYESIWRMNEDSILNEYNLFVVNNNFELDEEDTGILLDYIEAGGNALISSEYFYPLLKDTLNIKTTLYSRHGWLPLDLKQEYIEDTLIYHPGGKEIIIPANIFGSFFLSIKNDNISVIAEMVGKKPVLIRYSHGKGNLYLCTIPLLYTNYGILDESIKEFIELSISPLTNRPVIRSEFYGKGTQAEESQSIFRYLLSQQSLRWALYLALFTIILFMIFTAKRKQKAIPVIRQPHNNIVEFVRSIAGLYLLKNNNADIIRKKYIYWSEHIKQQYGIDLINEEHTYELYSRLALKIEHPLNEIRHLILSIDVIDENTVVSDSEMIELITKMNNIQ